MTPKQKQQFNQMRYTLTRISKVYNTPTKIRKDCDKKDSALDFDEALEMAYENIQQEAALAVKGVRKIDW